MNIKCLICGDPVVIDPETDDWIHEHGDDPYGHDPMPVRARA